MLRVITAILLSLILMFNTFPTISYVYVYEYISKLAASPSSTKASSNGLNNQDSLYELAIAGRIIKICGKKLHSLAGVETWRIHVYAYTACGFMELPILVFKNIEHMPIPIDRSSVVNATLFGMPMTVDRGSCILVKLPRCVPLYVKPSKLISILLDYVPRTEIGKLYIANVTIDLAKDPIIKAIIKELKQKIAPQPPRATPPITILERESQAITTSTINSGLELSTPKVTFDVVIAVTKFSNLYELNSLFLTPTILQPFEIYGLTTSELSSIERSCTLNSNAISAIRSFIYTPVTTSDINVESVNIDTFSNESTGMMNECETVDVVTPPTNKTWEGKNEVTIPIVLKPPFVNLHGYTVLGVYLEVLIYRSKGEEYNPVTMGITPVTTITSPISSSTSTYYTKSSIAKSTITTFHTKVTTTSMNMITSTSKSSTVTTSKTTATSTTTTSPGAQPGICLRVLPGNRCKYYVMSIARRLATIYSLETNINRCTLRIEATLELGNGTKLLKIVKYYAIPLNAPSLIVDYSPLPYNELSKLFSSIPQKIMVVYDIKAECPKSMTIDALKAITQYEVLRDKINEFAKRIEVSKILMDVYIAKNICIPAGIRKAIIIASLPPVSSIPLIEDVSGFTHLTLIATLKSIASKPVTLEFCAFRCVKAIIKPYEVNVPIKLSIDTPLSLIVSSLTTNQVPIFIKIIKQNPNDYIELHLALKGLKSTTLKSIPATRVDILFNNNILHDISLGISGGALKEPILAAYSISIPFTYDIVTERHLEIIGPNPASLYLWIGDIKPYVMGPEKEIKPLERLNWIRFSIALFRFLGSQIRFVNTIINITSLKLSIPVGQSIIIIHMLNEGRLKNLREILGTISGIINVVSLLLSLGSKYSILSTPLGIIGAIIDLAERGTISTGNIDCVKVKGFHVKIKSKNGYVYEYAASYECVAHIIPALYGILGSLGVAVDVHYDILPGYSTNISVSTTIAIVSAGKVIEINVVPVHTRIHTFKYSDLASAGIIW